MAAPPTPSLSFPGFVESFYHYAAAAAGSSNGSISSLQPFDVSLRNVSGTSYPANFSSFKYGTGVSRDSDGYALTGRQMGGQMSSMGKSFHPLQAVSFECSTMAGRKRRPAPSIS